MRGFERGSSIAQLAIGGDRADVQDLTHSVALRLTVERGGDQLPQRVAT
jgi:hypothetical protein